MAVKMQCDVSQKEIAGDADEASQVVTHKWYFSRKEIESHSPSRSDGIDYKQEEHLRKMYCSLMQELGMELKVGGVQVDGSVASLTPPEECVEKECSRKRGRSNSCNKAENKACRERQRREILNTRFLELSSTLEPDRPATTDKLAILGDAIRVLNQLKSESQDFKEMNEKLSEEIKTLKAEKNELREEKLILKAEKAKMEQQVKSMTNNFPPPGFMTPHPAAFQAGVNKMPVFPGYGYIPMWPYLPQSTCDTSHDHELRPPAA